MNYSESLRRRAQIELGAENDQAKQQAAIELCSRGPEGCVFFIENFCWTFDPRENPQDLPFILYDYQREYVHWLVERIDNGEDALTDKSRDMGATYLTLCVFLWYWLFRPNSRFLVGSRKEALVDGKQESEDDAPLFKKIDYTLERLPSWILPSRHDRTFLNLTNADNGAQITGESANEDFGRGGRYKATLLDEFAFWDFDTEAWKACSQSTRCRIALSTAAPIGKFKRLRFGTDGESIRTKTLHWSLHPKKDAAWYAIERTRLDADTLAQEVDISYETSAKGSVYGTEMKLVKYGLFPYVPEWPLYVSHDPGLDDCHAIGFWQIDPHTGRVRLILSFEKSGGIAAWFFPFFGQPIDSTFPYTDTELAIIERTKRFKKAIHFGDPAGKNRNQVTGTSVYDAFKSIGIVIQTNDLANEFTERRAATKKLLMTGVEVNTTEYAGPDGKLLKENAQWQLCMEQAHYPKRAETSQATTAVVHPVHDWTSHMRTMTEYFAVNLPKPNVQSIPSAPVGGVASLIPGTIA